MGGSEAWTSPVGGHGSKYLAVLDFEATCDEKRHAGTWDPTLQEIIEIPVALIATEERRVVDTFCSLVKPQRQPVLSAFCTQLTSIRQSEVDASPPIEGVMRALEEFFLSHGATEHDTLVVTCGDWDLKSMWPRQIFLSPQLSTPPLFRSWCNIKQSFARHMKRKTNSMMGMLRALGLEHQGHHHRGIDDVNNLARITISLLEQGASFEATWSEREREREHALWARRLHELERQRAEKVQALSRLPSSVRPEIREALTRRAATLDGELQLAQAHLRVFEPETGERMR